MKKRAKTDTVHVSTRMRESLRAKLEAAAKRNDVSLNAEMSARLEASFERDEIRDAVAEAKAGVAELFGYMAKQMDTTDAQADAVSAKLRARREEMAAYEAEIDVLEKRLEGKMVAIEKRIGRGK